jgi:serine protease Do
MYRNMLKPVLFLAIIVMIVSLACGGSTQVATQVPPTQAPPTQAPPTEAPPTETATPALPTETSAPKATEVPAGLVTNLSDLKSATVQIIAEGTFVDPQFGYIANAAGSGSGFIIDPSGIAVTNNHVVTGAALLQVYVGGDTSKVYNAKILGVSECSDLAVIDIEGDGFPYVSWYDVPAKVGLEVYTAGYPFGNPEFTMTKGIVSKENADGNTSWASVKSVIEHDAMINPGNSGGPLVDANATVVGVNYASNAANQYFAIDHVAAIPVIDQLKTGKDVDSIGINGQAVVSEDGTISGIWVSSVKSGSPADKTGVKPGDLVTQLENLYLATDGTMKDYCDVLRTHNASDTLQIQVVQWDTQEVYEGQLNGRALEYTSTLSGGTGGTGTSTSTSVNCVASSTSGYNTCTDDSGNLSVDVPDTWTDVIGSPWTYDGQDIGLAISAAPNLSDFQGYYNAEGMFFGASDKLADYGGYVQFLDFYTVDSYKVDCTFKGRFDYNDTVYRGKYDFYTNCGGAGGYDAYILSAVDIADPTSKIILIEVQVVPGDTTTVEQIWNTFYVLF